MTHEYYRPFRYVLSDPYLPFQIPLLIQETHTSVCSCSSLSKTKSHHRKICIENNLYSPMYQVVVDSNIIWEQVSFTHYCYALTSTNRQVNCDPCRIVDFYFSFLWSWNRHLKGDLSPLIWYEQLCPYIGWLAIMWPSQRVTR